MEQATGIQSPNSRPDNFTNLIFGLGLGLVFFGMGSMIRCTIGPYSPCRKPNNTILYIDARSNHPPLMLKHLPVAINQRISGISYNKNNSDKTTNFTYMTNCTSTPQQSTPSHHRKNRQSKIICYLAFFSQEYFWGY